MTQTLDLSAQNVEAYVALFGMNDQHITLIEQECNVTIALRGSSLIISGEEPDVQVASESIRLLLNMIHRGEIVDRVRIRYVLSMAREGNADVMNEGLKSIIAVTHRGKQIQCKTLGQIQYVDTIRRHDLTFAIGPAGTGKTYLAMALAVVALKNKEVERIILTRPAVEAGEKLGFLPGDLTQKVDPYLRPLYDALYDFMGPDAYTRLAERGIVEVAPLAYMRGRTLSDAFIILDEAQNTTSEQMKMFLTRMGFRSRVVVTGDITQTDLPFGKRSGLEEAVEILREIPAIGIVELTTKDIVRHELVQQIIEAYDARHAAEVRRRKESELFGRKDRSDRETEG
ncbi:MAG: PhoH family protein [Clostridia bacterium]|nr:PhoH family protein [Clostridia bacterium]